MRLSVENLQQYLLQFTYGKEMQKLKAFEDWSKGAAKRDAKPQFCDMCDVPALSGLKECPARHCGVKFCNRDYCNESFVHLCTNGGGVVKYCNKFCFTCEDCETDICPKCSQVCRICEFTYCDSHSTRLHGSVICNQCVDDASEKLKKRKIDGDK